MMSTRDSSHHSPPRAYRYRLRNNVCPDDVRDVWQRAIAECQRRFGTYRVRRETSHTLCAGYRELIISARTEVGLVLNAVFHQTLPDHWLESVSEVQARQQAA